MDRVVLVYQCGDFCMPCVIGVATDKETGKTIIHKKYQHLSSCWHDEKSLEELPDDKFRVVGEEDILYWMKEVKLNQYAYRF